ncbi:MAG: hypothetical protein JNK05_24265 [Myxococcales bacterium]|nr:hypothetical protein [Myxococcales bacterium]
MSSDTLEAPEPAEPEPLASAEGTISVEELEALYAEIDRLDAVVSELTDELSAREERIESLEAELRDKSRAARLATNTPSANLERTLSQRESDLNAAVSELVATREASEQLRQQSAQREAQMRADHEATLRTVAALKAQLAARSVDIATECDRAERAEQALAKAREELAATLEVKRALERENSALTVQLCETEERLAIEPRDVVRAAS